MKKFSILALALILSAGLFTACTGTMTDESTGPSTTTVPTTAPTSAPTTAPTTAPTVPATKPASTDPSKGSDPTETTGGVNTLDPTGNGDGKKGPRMLPWPGMPGGR